MPGPRTTATYEPKSVEVAYSALMEVVAALQSYRDALVLIGGWVPYLQLRRHQEPDNAFRHVGSIDSDWVVDPRKVSQHEYDTIVQTLKKRGWAETPETQFRLVRTFILPGTTVSLDIAVDFLTEVPPRGQGAGRRHRKIQKDLNARAAPAAELVLAHHQAMELQGTLFGGGQIRLPIQIADVVGSIGTKGLALGRRYEEKDNYDLYALIANFGGGPVEVAALVRPFVGERLLRKSLGQIREWFADITSAGPAAVAGFFIDETGPAKDRRIRDSFETVDRFLRELGL